MSGGFMSSLFGKKGDEAMSGGFMSSLFGKKGDEDEFMSSLFGKKHDEDELTYLCTARVFKHEELKRATRSFTTELGIGAFGSVYRGTLRDGRTVAVKVLHNNNPGRLQEFVNEFTVLSRLRHRYLVTLYGCTDPRCKELLIVYEYVPNGSVEDHLHVYRSDLTLAMRVRIAVETAEALAYLHTNVPPLIHRDVKTSNIILGHDLHVKVGDLAPNIILDNDLHVKVGDLARLPRNATQVTTMPQGTLGYRDPEYDHTLILTDKSDVYSFGVVLVELISGKMAVDISQAPDNIYLVSLALDKIINNNLDNFIDPKLRYNSNIRLKRVINSLAELAGKCLHSTGAMRPTMVQVLIELKQIDGELQQVGEVNVPPQELGDDSLIEDSLWKKKSDEKEPTNFGLTRVFKHEELKKATNHFTTKLGMGGCGSVYLGTLTDRNMVAVKVLHNYNPNRLQEFVNEVVILSRLRHKNLVSLHGCTNPRGNELLLVYDYVSNGTVDDHLHRLQSDLTMALRVQIMMETAEALEYLHALEPPLIHRDVKPANIMLDPDFHIKICDLGFCRLLPWDATQVTTVPQGTYGYRDPEYDRTFILTVKSDVYSFGVMMVELISRKIALDVDRFPDSIYLADLALDKIINKKLDGFVDPKLGYNSNVCVKRAINSLAELACKCLHSTGTERPTMKEVLTELNQIEDLLQQTGVNVPLQELGDDSLTDGGEATIEDPDNGASIYGPGRDSINLLDNKSLSLDIKDLMRASEDVMGKGKLGTTYRATLESGPAVIVKRLGEINALSKEEFSQQMQLLQQVKHENLVEIIGFFDSEDEKLIIYENVPGASLYKLLHGYLGAEEEPLNWAARLFIVKGMARGLAHLHNAQYSSKILHANLKSSNVLVVQDNRSHPATNHAKLTDFGFLPFFQSVGQAQNLAIASTPELSQGKKPSQKADVYCFGLVLLEVIMGKDPDEEDLRERVMSTPEDDWITTTMLDMEIAAEVDGHEEEMRTLIRIALECTSEWPNRRPSMRELVREMEEIGKPDREEGSSS